MTDSVGFIGLGIMGSRMAANLRRAGFELVVWNRTESKALEFARAHGAEVSKSPAALAGACEVVVTMVVDGDQVESVLLGPDGVASGSDRGSDLLCVDMSTIGPQAARGIGAALSEREIGFVDAPVTGSSPKAEDGTLTIMAGGDEADFGRALALFEAMGDLVVHVGPLGSGQAVKVINNAVAAVNTAAAAEALLAATAEGVDLDALLKVMGAGSGASAMLELKAGPMRSHDYTTLFKLEHMLKDLRLCLAEAEAAGVRMELVKQVEGLLAEGVELGHGEHDFAALFEVLERRAGGAARTR